MEFETEPELDLPIRPGQLVGGKYLVERVLGVGGMGAVVLALHRELQQRVALKFLLSGKRSAGDRERFLREARAAVALTSPHVARVFDVGSLPSGEPYMVMEYLDGKDLGAVLQERGPMLPSDVVTYALEACDALAEAHSLGIVHRDIKPANLFLASRPDGRTMLKVLDFGISKMEGPAISNALTSTTAVMGTPHYMSPEQLLSSKNVDARADIWSLGVTLFRLLTGALPFEADTLPELTMKIMGQDIPSVRAVRPEVPPALADVIQQCLQRDPARRFASAGVLAKALAAAREGRALPADAASPEKTVPTVHSEATAQTVLSPSSVRTGDTHEAVSGAGPTVAPRSSAGWTVAVVVVLAAMAFSLYLKITARRSAAVAPEVHVEPPPPTVATADPPAPSAAPAPPPSAVASASAGASSSSPRTSDRPTAARPPPARPSGSKGGGKIPDLL